MRNSEFYGTAKYCVGAFDFRVMPPLERGVELKIYCRITKPQTALRAAPSTNSTKSFPHNKALRKLLALLGSCRRYETQGVWPSFFRSATRTRMAADSREVTSIECDSSTRVLIGVQLLPQLAWGRRTFESERLSSQPPTYHHRKFWVLAQPRRAYKCHTLIFFSYFLAFLLVSSAIPRFVHNNEGLNIDNRWRFQSSGFQFTVTTHEKA